MIEFVYLSHAVCYGSNLCLPSRQILMRFFVPSYSSRVYCCVSSFCAWLQCPTHGSNMGSGIISNESECSWHKCSLEKFFFLATDSYLNHVYLFIFLDCFCALFCKIPAFSLSASSSFPHFCWLWYQLPGKQNIFVKQT